MYVLDTTKINIFYCSIRNIRGIFKQIKHKKDHEISFKIACESIYNKFNFDISMISKNSVIFILFPFQDGKIVDYGYKDILNCKISSMLLARYYYELALLGISIPNDIMENVYSKCIIETKSSADFIDDLYFETNAFKVVREMAPFKVEFQKKIRDFEKEKEVHDNSEIKPKKKRKFYKLVWQTYSGEKSVGRIYDGDIIEYIKRKLKDFPVKNDELEEGKVKETKTVVSSGSKRYREEEY
jgi:hypothetical protein